MGILLPCNFPRKSKEDSDSQSQFSNHHLNSDSSTSSSISSKPSLPSVPSLTSPSQLLDQPSAAAAHHLCLFTLRAHSSNVFSLSLAGKHLYSGSSNSEIRQWSRDLSTLHNSADNVVVSGSSAVKSIVVLGDKLFSAHQDHKIRVWKIDANSNGAGANNQRYYKCVAALPTLGDRVARLLSAKNYVEVRRHKKCTWVHHVDTVSAMALSKDGALLYSASWDRTFKVWRTTDLKCLESVWNAHDDAINAVVSSSDGCVYTGSADKKIKVWKRDDDREGDKKHKLMGTLEKHKSAVNALALSPDGSVLYSGACDKSIIVWEKDGAGVGGDEMVAIGALRGHTKAVLCLVAVSDLVVSGSADKTVRVWRRGVGRRYSCLGVLEGHRGPVKCLAAAVDSCNGGGDDCNSCSGTSYNVYSGGLDFDIKIWKIWVPLL
ncbi:hypothetical protein U1Q18_016984 [Sarracenia purpurea var. burkii]